MPKAYAQAPYILHTIEENAGINYNACQIYWIFIVGIFPNLLEVRVYDGGYFNRLRL